MSGNFAARSVAWLRPPKLPDPVHQRVAGSVHFLSLTFTAALLLVAVPATMLAPRPIAFLPTMLGLFSASIGALLLVHLRRPYAASGVLVGGLWLCSTLAALAGTRIMGDSSALYLIVICAAGVLLGRWGALGATVLSAAAVLGLSLLRSQGLLVLTVERSVWTVALGQLTTLIGAGAIAVESLHRLHDALVRVVTSESQARALIDQAADPIVVMTREGRILEASVSACEMTGYSREELCSSRLSDLARLESMIGYEGLLGDLAPGDRLSGERRLTRSDGTRLDVEASIACLEDGRVQVIIRDLSERNAAAEAQRRLRIALNESGTGIVFFDGSLRLVYANETFWEQFGATAPLEPGTRLDEIAAVFNRQDLVERMRAEFRAGRRFSARVAHEGPSGSKVVNDVTLATVYDGTDRPTGYIGTSRDVTHEAELEERLQLSRQFQAVGELASSVAHEFNNLLTVILGSAEALRDSSPSVEVEEIFEAGQRGSALTAKLRSLSRKQAVHFRTVDLNQVVGDSVSMLQRVVRENTMIELRLAPEPAWVDADPNQIQQVLLNLTANAHDAMPAGGVLEIGTGRFELSARSRPHSVSLPDGSYVVLSVRDSGVGMPKDVLEHAFEPFFTTKEEGRGSGLGLPSVSSVVEESGGAIRMESEIGRGTLVEIFLPSALPEAGRDDTGARAPQAQTARKARVLVVEDDPLLRGLIRRALEAEGHSVLTAKDGPEALEIVRSPELIVSDVVLPSMDGRELLATFRSRNPGVPAVLMSRYAPDHLPDLVADETCTGFLPKPFKMEELIRCVDNLLALEDTTHTARD